jgi:enoyl-CoA hydratase/carnithine racemase
VLDSGTEYLLVDARDHVAWITLNNPRRRNAINGPILAGLPALLATIEADPAFRVVVLTGAGSDAFASGIDVTELDARSAEVRAAYAELIAAVRNVRLPVIAMIDGACLGGGLEIALAADLRHATDRASFGIPAASLGIAYVDPSSLTAAVGPGRAAELLFTAARIDAAVAAAIGLVDAVHPAGDIDAEVRRLAGTIAANAPLAVRAMKTALAESRKPSSERDTALLAQLARECAESDDHREGLSALREKRTPRFRGR